MWFSKTQTKTMQRLFLYLILLISVAACKERDKRFEYIPLEKYKYEPAYIKDGTDFRILSFSGGPPCTTEEAYYYQFIAINKETLDTIRILAPCQIVENVGDSTQGTFSSYNEQAEIVNKVLREHGEKAFDEGEKIVVFNKLHKDLEARKFKTVIGSIGF